MIGVVCFIQYVLCLLETEIEFPPFSMIFIENVELNSSWSSGVVKKFLFTNELVHSTLLKEK